MEPEKIVRYTFTFRLIPSTVLVCGVQY